jgi:probable F420-dependent oxidoreductase
MKFGIYSSIANPPRGEHLDRCVKEVIAEAQLAEESGFDACFFGEHHQDKDGFLPSPLIVATAVAAQTRRLDVGTSVILLPLHHPVHVAEDVITLDIVSKGRVILGVGIGYQAADFRAFAVPMEHRVALFEEGVEIIRKCWSGEPFSFHGAHYTLEDVQIRPRPFQTPAPPLWIGASVPAAARRAGRLGDAFVATPSTDLESTIRLVNVYQQAALQAGRQPQVVLMRDAWVAQTHAEAAAVYGPEVMTAYHYYWQSSGTLAQKWSLRWRISPPIGSSLAIPRRVSANSSAGMRRRERITFFSASAMPTRADRRMRKSCRRSGYSENACCPTVAENREGVLQEKRKHGATVWSRDNLRHARGPRTASPWSVAVPSCSVTIRSAMIPPHRRYRNPCCRGGEP